MKIVYFDAFSGISGDMIIGAFLDAGLDFNYLQNNLKKLNLPDYKLEQKKVEKNNIAGTKFTVVVSEDRTGRNLDDIVEIINKSSLTDSIKIRSIDIFTDIAKVEAKIHNKEIKNIHFHEVGATDSIIDIVGTIISLEYFKIEKVYFSKISLGSGFINSKHGKIPVPAPATVELLKGVPVSYPGIESELTTPTGAAIAAYLSKGFTNIPDMIYTATGYGAGTRDLEIPNLLRIFIADIAKPEYKSDEVSLIETNIDDLNPEFYQHIFNRLLEKGALDVFIIPVIMKKSRPGNLLSVIANKNEVDKLIDIIFQETTTSGIRINQVNRKKLLREIKQVNTEYGEINVKINRSDSKILTISPEYDDCERIARKTGKPVKEIYDVAREAAKIFFSSIDA